MARWIALYLLTGYDKVWSALQNLSVLTKQPFPLVVLDQDGTIASGDWYARELCSALDTGTYINVFCDGGSIKISGDGYSLFALIQTLNTIAEGDWIGVDGNPLSPPFHGDVTRPVSFRERLAAAAVSPSPDPNLWPYLVSTVN
jgi:hypothetical protein